MNELIETLKVLEKQKNGEELLSSLEIIANLMRELSNGRRTSANYSRVFQHDVLTIKINFGEGYGRKG